MSRKLKLVVILKPREHSGKIGVLDDIGSLIYWDPKREGVFEDTMKKGRVNALDFQSALPVRFMEYEDKAEPEVTGTREIQG